MAIETVEDINLGFDEEIIRVKRRQAKWKQHRDFYAPIINALLKHGCEIDMSDSYLNVRVSGDKEKLASCFKILRAGTMNFTGDRPAKGDTSWSSFWTAEGISLQIYFYFSSTICKRVPTGKKRIVEVDEFETVCDQVELPPAEPVAVIEGASNEV